MIFVNMFRGFTSISEKMTPKENFQFLNEYLSTIGPIFRSNNGFIDKYIGDGIFSLFPRPGSSLKACIDIQLAIDSFNKLHKERYPNVNLGIGVHTGSVVAGLIGETGRVQGTIIGDTVNTASRIESLTKRYGARIMTSKETLDSHHSYLSENNLMSAAVNYRYLGRIRVVGKEVPVEMYEILIPEMDALKISTSQTFQKGVDLMFNSPYDMVSAANEFKQVLDEDPNDVAAKLRFNQAQEMAHHKEMLDSWTGEEILIEK
jgi:class 3 adenylate cyclase